MDNFFRFVKLALFNSNLWIGAIVIIYLGYLFFKSTEKEEFLIFKIIGFYVLGTFTFKFHVYDKSPIIIPIGILIYMFFMKNKGRLNHLIKNKAAILGIISMCINFMCSYIYDLVEYRDLNIESIGLTKETINEDWSNISQKLQIERDLIVREFRLIYDTEDNIEQLYYTVKDSDRSYNIDYNINPNYEKAKIKVTVDKIDSNEYQELDYFYEDQYSNYIDINRFMEVIDNLKFKEEKVINGKKVDNYNVVYRAEDYMVNKWSINEGGEVFLVDELNGYSYEKIKQRYLPAQGINLLLLPNERLSEGSWSSISTDYYMIDAVFNNELISPETEQLEVICESHNVRKSTSDSSIDTYSVLDTLDFSSWEEENILEMNFIESQTKASIIINDSNGVKISLYEDIPYAKYESELEIVLFRIPSNIYNEIEYLIE